MKNTKSTSTKKEPVAKATRKKEPVAKATSSSRNLNHSNTFDPNKYMVDIKGKDYLPVAARIAWMRSEHKDWRIRTEIYELANKAVLMRATIYDGQGCALASGHKKETMAGFPDYIEKAETGAIGRALAMCGYGTIQSLDFEEGERIADAPV